MKNKRILGVAIITLTIALIIIIVMSKQNKASEITNTDNIENELQNVIENIIEEDVESEENNNEISIGEIVQEEKVVEQEIVNTKIEEPKQAVQKTQKTQEKKAESSKQQEQPKETAHQKVQKVEPVVEIKEKSKVEEQPKQEAKPIEQQAPKCSNTKHGVGVGNSNKWFNSYNEAVSYYDNLITSLSNKVHNGEITNDEYYKKCPYGYETWSCPYCEKWTLNCYYR